MWEDLTRNWGWPLLLRTGLMCLAPERLVLGVLGGALVLVLTRFIGDWRYEEGGPLDLSPAQVSFFGIDPGRLTLPGAAYWSIMLLVLTPVGVAIGRSAIVRISCEARLGTRGSVLFVVQTWKAWLGAVVLQSSLLLVMSGMTALLWLNNSALLGNLAYLLAGLTGIFWVVLLVLQSMVPAAIAAERSDAVDALQRSGAYLFAGFLRLVVYLLIVGVVAALLIWFFQTGWMIGEGALPPGRRSVPVFDLAEGVLRLIGSGVVISYSYTAGGMVYLLMRRAVDQQDMREVWVERVGDAGSG